MRRPIPVESFFSSFRPFFSVQPSRLCRHPLLCERFSSGASWVFDSTSAFLRLCESLGLRNLPFVRCPPVQEEVLERQVHFLACQKAAECVQAKATKHCRRLTSVRFNGGCS